MALANMGHDLLGRPRELYSYAACLSKARATTKTSSPTCAHVRQYRNLLLLEQPKRRLSRAPWCGSSSMLLFAGSLLAAL
jgi:hypothetical protein